MAAPDPMPDKRPDASQQQSLEEQAQVAPVDAEDRDQLDREYDRRGVLLPARARVGGIITPQ